MPTQQTIPYTITASPLPSNFVGTPQEFFEAMLDRIEITSTAATFVVGSVGESAPTENLGPWLKNGTKWYVWDETTSAYIPLDISDSLNPDIVISATEPDPAETQVWAVLGTNSVTMLKFYLGATLGWVEMDRELKTGSVIEDYIADDAVTRTKIKNGEVIAAKIQNDLPVTKLAAGSATYFLRVSASGTIVWAPNILSSPELTIVASSAIEHAHGLTIAPSYFRAVVVCKTAEDGWAVGDEVDFSTNGSDDGTPVYANATQVGVLCPSGLAFVKKSAPNGSQSNITLGNWRLKFYYSLG